jgi:hypothetical protein
VLIVFEDLEKNSSSRAWGFYTDLDRKKTDYEKVGLRAMY